MNQDDSDKDLKNGAVREIHNMVHTKGGFGNNPRLEMILGTVEVANTLPSGDNIHIGSIEDVENDLLYYFNYNSKSTHGIYEYDPATESVTKIIENSFFPFTETSYIRGSVADGMLFFTEGAAVPLYVNIPFAKAGSYLNVSIREFTYAKPFPKNVILASRLTDGNVLINRVAHDSYKFAYRLIYFDDAQTKISGFSQLVAADLEPPTNENANNVIFLRVLIEEDIEHLVKEIEFIYEKNNTGSFHIFTTEERPDDGWVVAANPDGNYHVNFDATESTIIVPTQDYVDPFENIPRLTSDITIKGNRLLMDKGLFGHEGEGTAVISLSVIESDTPHEGKAAKGGGIYSAGIVYEDEYGWESPVLKKVSIQVPYIGSLNDGSNMSIRAVITGKAPDWAKRWHLVFAEDSVYDTYEEFPVYVMIGSGAAPASAADGSTTVNGLLLILGGWYYFNKNASDAEITGLGPTVNVHLRMPSNIPFYPTTEMYGRFKQDDYIADPLIGKEFPIQDVVGDKMYIDNFGDADKWLTFGHRWVNVEVYTKKTVNSGIYNKVGISGDVYQGIRGPKYTHEDATVVWKGDQYIIVTPNRLAYIFNSDPLVSSDIDQDFLGENMPHKRSGIVFSPSPTAGSTITTAAGFDAAALDGFILSAFTLDYKKIDSDRSGSYAEGKPTEVESNDVILYSDPYLPNTLVNGFFNIGLLSEETVGVEDGAIQRMFSIGERTVLAVHKHAVTSIYMGQGVLRSVDGNELVSKSDDVIGYTNRAKGRYGSGNPESFAYHDDRVYFWDGSRGDVVRYAQNGVDPLGKANEFKSYFKKIADDRRKVPGGYKAYGMYNPEHEMYILSFPDASYDAVSLPAITIAYTERGGKFVDFFGISPTSGGKVSDKLIMFNGGRIYQWNKAGYKFFGVDFYPKIVLVFNGATEVEKLLKNLVIDSDGAWRVDIVSSAGSVTYTSADEFVEKEKNKFYGDVYRDVSSSGAYPDTGSGGSRFNGDTIRGETFEVTVSRAVSGAVSISELMLTSKALSGHLGIR